MKDHPVKLKTAIIVIIAAITLCFVAYNRATDLIDQSYVNGFNAGAQIQKMMDDAKQLKNAGKPAKQPVALAL